MTMIAAEVEELARRCTAGDDDAMDELLRQIRPLVLRLCARFLPCREDAEDACQDTLLAVARGISGWDGRALFSTWLYRVAANRSRSTYEVLRRRAVELTADALPEPVDPRTTSVVAGTRLDLLEGLRALPTPTAEALALRDVLDLEYRQIAELLEVPEGTVRSRIHDGRRRLRQELAG